VVPFALTVPHRGRQTAVHRDDPDHLDRLALSAGGDTTAIKSKDAKATVRVDASGKLPKPNLKGSTATYPSAYGKGIDLVVTATPTGFRQQIVLRERPAGPVTFRIPDAEFLFWWPDGISKDRVHRCEVGVVAFIPGEDEGTGLAIPLWNRKLVDTRYILEQDKILRHGSGIPVSDWDGYPYTELVPEVQCDWQSSAGPEPPPASEAASSLRSPEYS
jgi:hypothetical protein